METETDHTDRDPAYSAAFVGGMAALAAASLAYGLHYSLYRASSGTLAISILGIFGELISDTILGAVLVLIVGLPFSFALSFLGGIPIHFSLRKLGWDAEWIYVLFACLLGVSILHLFNENTGLTNALFYALALIPGTAGGIAFWRVANRPAAYDRFHGADYLIPVFLVLAISIAHHLSLSPLTYDASRGVSLYLEFTATKLPYYYIAAAVILAFALVVRLFNRSAAIILALSTLILPVLGAFEAEKSSGMVRLPFGGAQFTMSTKYKPEILEGGSIRFQGDTPKLRALFNIPEDRLSLGQPHWRSETISVYVSPQAQPFALEDIGVNWNIEKVWSQENGLTCMKRKQPVTDRVLQYNEFDSVCINIERGVGVTTLLRFKDKRYAHLFFSKGKRYTMFMDQDIRSEWHLIEAEVTVLFEKEVAD